eukprot:187456-Chlamydomonas_euryale.AAC.1
MGGGVRRGMQWIESTACTLGSDVAARCRHLRRHRRHASALSAADANAVAKPAVAQPAESAIAQPA